ncbi:tryptophan transporter [Caryophanon latum]|uniref:Tryptophan transporter n=1 Tax=Caryophanon latum TaxID=33977 RepID=A0A1C0YFQ4_9BACL|nr:tryptophan transporter [Caryophanon latum]OCS86000.1 tryptophan transporter [Caryophanon latum]
MNTKNLVLMAMLVGVGTALYLFMPPINGMKPDFMLTMMFIGILLFTTLRDTFLLSLTTGVLSGLFTTFPAGFVPNIIDKFVTGLLFFAAVVALRKAARSVAAGTVLTVIGTAISGAIFLGAAIFVTGFEGAFTEMFIIVVLPAMAINAIAFFIIFPIITNLVKRSKFETALN